MFRHSSINSTLNGISSCGTNSGQVEIVIDGVNGEGEEQEQVGTEMAEGGARLTSFAYLGIKKNYKKRRRG